jgi:hypothetical protein
LYAHLQSRKRTPVYDELGKIKGWTTTLESPSVAEYRFLDLYTDAVNTLDHFVLMLKELETIPPFGLDALPFDVSADSQSGSNSVPQPESR